MSWDVCWNPGKPRRLQEILWIILKELETWYPWRLSQQKQDCWSPQIPYFKEWRRPNLIQRICSKNEGRIEGYLLYHWREQSCCPKLSIPWSPQEEGLRSPLLSWSYWWVHGSIIERLWLQETQILHQRRTWTWWNWRREEVKRRREG